MLTVPEQLMHSTVRIECVGNDEQSSTGTGFFFKFLDDGKSHVPAIVTNKHVIRNSRVGAFHLTRRSADGTAAVGSHLRIELEDFASLWLEHPDPAVDLAVFPCASVLSRSVHASSPLFYINLDPSLIPDREQIENLVGFDDIIMVGYPNGLWDSVNNLPILRAGKTATHPKYDYEGKPYFLIDCACFPGSSGSPVFIYDRNGWSDRNGTVSAEQERLLFLGVLFAGPLHTAEDPAGVVAIPELARVAKALSSIPNNIGFVVKSARLLDFDAILSRQRVTRGKDMRATHAQPAASDWCDT